MAAFFRRCEEFGIIGVALYEALDEFRADFVVRG